MNASQRGLNPYDPNKAAAAYDNSARDPYGERAIGMNGDMLDAMLKGRWQEGYDTGHEDGHQAARANFSRVFDEGFDRGLLTGTQEEGARLGRAFLPLLQQTGAVLATVQEKTGSAEIKGACGAQLEIIRETLNQHIGTYAEQSQATAGVQPPQSA